VEVYASCLIPLRGVYCLRERERVSALLLLLVILLGASLFQNQISQNLTSPGSKVLSDGGKIDPFEVSIQGSIVDNYANISYCLFYDNYASETASEIEWFLGLQSELRLSNISVELGSKIYWGRVLPEVQAIEIYNESVEANKSAVLVQRYEDGYAIKMNVESGAEVLLSVFVEGLLTRHSGLYSLSLPVGRNGIENTGFAFSLEIISNFAPVTGFSVHGLPNIVASDLSSGIRLEYTADTLTIEERIEVIYTLDRQTGGAQLLAYNNGSENFFVYLLAPSIVEDVESARRQYVFVLDRSGSMSGIKIQQAKVAFNTMIGGLRTIDTFNVIAFDHEILKLWNEPHSGTTTNIQDAQNWINSISARGSTNFHDAAISGLLTFAEGANAKAMLMLSDGLPTAGEIQSPEGILSAIAEANTLDISIATVAFGSDSDENLMANIATQNNGFFVFIEPDEDASTELLDFYRIFSTPVADDYEIIFSGAFEVVSLSPLRESAFFNGTEIVVSGRYIEGMTVTTSIDYVTGTEIYTNTIGGATQEYEHVEFIWAQQRINYLLKIIKLHGENETLRSQITSIGMQYGIAVGGYTAMVLTAYDTSSIEEDPVDDYTYPSPSPPATHITYAAPIAPPAFDSSLNIVSSSMVFGILGLVVIILLVSRNRRG